MADANLSPNSQTHRRARLVINPIAGGDQPNLERLPEIVAALETGGIRSDIAFTSSEESPTQIAQRAVTEGYDLVVVGGGDGTVSEVAKGLIHAPVPLGIVPIGTYNNIARSLNLPTDLAEACQVLAQGEMRSIDVGVANDQHYFFEAAGVGLDAALFPLGEEIKGGRWGRMMRAAQLTLNYKPKRLHIRFDRPLTQAIPSAILRKRRFLWRRAASEKYEIRRSALLIVIANGPFYGTGFTVAPDAILDDGLLTVSVFSNFSKWELLRHFWSISLGRYQYSPKIETFRAAEVRLTSKTKLPVHIDGHPIGELPVKLNILQQALRVMVPNQNTPVYQAKADPNPPVALPVAEADEAKFSGRD